MGEDRKKTDFCVTMKWTTAVNVKSRLKIKYDDEFLFIGSCFSENISEKMNRLGFRTWANPLGIIYNPVSLSKSLRLIDDSAQIDDKLFVERDGHHFHYDLHSQNYFKTTSEFNEYIGLQHKRQAEIVDKVKANDSQLNVFVTLGTAWVYREKTSSKIVANCHKQDASLFEKVLLTETEIISELQSIITKNWPVKSNFIFTVSPIRHIKDGMVENQVSKSRLLSAVYEIAKKNDSVQYFPAYEIMVDELRDYRFYTDDLLHPTSFAINHIWDVFQSAYMTESTLQLMNKYAKLVAMKEHRSLFPESQESKDFQLKLSKKWEQFRKDHSSVDVPDF